MDTWIQNILIYVIMSALLRALITNESYLSFFRFTSGIILLLILISPLLSLGSGDWYALLEQNVFQIDTSQIEQELSVSEGCFEEALLSQYEEEVAGQVKKLVEKEKKGEAEVEVAIEENKRGEVGISRIEVFFNEGGEAEEYQSAFSDTGSENSRVKPVDIQVGEEGEENTKTKKKEGTESKETQKLRKVICSQFDLSKDKVVIINGS